jgi:cytochrome c oxidase assembly protein subunit 15
MTSALKPGRSQAVALWLFAVAALVFAMVMLGGTTRLTNSGLSITEWKPVRGVIPPVSAADWAAEFQAYQRIPQYRLINNGMSLDAFKAIYWWEWAHRLLGRIVGVAFALPFLSFLYLKKIPAGLVWRCWLLLALGALQGAVGWWMVSSGLADRVEVAPERLTIHLGLALAVFCLLVWTGLDAWSGLARPAQRPIWPAISAALAAGVFGQILLGGLVAGNRAGLVYNDWPMMNGRLLPDDYWQGGFWHSALHSQGAVQLHHRLGAYVLFLAAWVVALSARRSVVLSEADKRLAWALAILVTAQAALGIVTLRVGDPFGLAVAHQAVAALVLASAIGFAWRARRP